MWVIKYGRHFVYLKYKEYRFETRILALALVVYLWWHFRYSMSIYPVRYIKIYKSEDVVRLKTYSASKTGDYERLKRSTIRKMPRKW